MKMRTDLLASRCPPARCGDNLEPLPEPDDGGDDGDDDRVVEQVTPASTRRPAPRARWLGIPGRRASTATAPTASTRTLLDHGHAVRLRRHGLVHRLEQPPGPPRARRRHGGDRGRLDRSDLPGRRRARQRRAPSAPSEGALGTDVQLNHPTDLVEAARRRRSCVMAWHNHKLRTDRSGHRHGHDHLPAPAPASPATAARPAAALFKQPKALALDEDGNLYILDQQNFRVRKIDADGIDHARSPATACRASAATAARRSTAQLNFEAGSNPEPSGGLAVADGKLYIADTLNHRIRVVDLASRHHRRRSPAPASAGYAGDGGPALEAKLNQPARPRDRARRRPLRRRHRQQRHPRDRPRDRRHPHAWPAPASSASSDEGLPALETKLRRPFGIEFDPDGNLYIWTRSTAAS